MRRYRTIVVAGAAALLLLLVSATAAQATPRLPGRILYLTFPGPVAQGGGGLHSARPDGSSPTSIPAILPIYGFPDYSPDGTRIAYVQDWSFYTMAADGSDVQWLVDAPYGPSNPRWSPDGKWIIGESGGDIWEVSKDGHAAGWTDLTGNYIFNDLQPSWAPGGKRFATANNPGVQIYSADGSRTRTVTDLPDAVRLAWSPKGDVLAVQARDDLWLVDVGTGAATQVTNTADTEEFSPIWSPDGKWLAYAHGPGAFQEDQLESTADPVVWLMNKSGGDQHSTGIHGVPTSWRDIP